MKKLNIIFPGFVYTKLDYACAITDFDRTIRIDPNSASAYLGRVFTYYAKHDYEKAISDFEAVLRIKPNSANARQYLELARKARGGNRPYSDRQSG